ncbi:DUF3087 domain-containing protein [Agaribacter marinus]|uniref:Medium chain reductase/dehydrogenase n=1 Tax=Agaribacter marinus TaxID=1431249 RepID=A0AA37WJS4_9ALTE|nr:DUF3087 domain-containing protein [Agaribacter marinus]GLR70549.1 medium chain reductase/dehydrogenase [Agaribacter marinus]
MKLIDIDKTRYRKHLNRVIAACIATLVIVSLAISQTLIALFPDESGSHFHWNLFGVVVAVVLIGITLRHYRKHSYMVEVTYVWDLKQSLNKINRKIRKVEALAKQGNTQAMLVLQYSYAGSKQLWQLDDNTILMDELIIKQAELDSLAQQFNVQLNADEYDEANLLHF